MANDYFDTFTSMVAHAIARSELVNAALQSIISAFDKFPRLKALKEGRVTYATDSGTPNVYLLTLPQAPTEYNDGLKAAFVPLNTNTGPSTVNIYDPNAALLGAKNLTRFDGNVLQAADVPNPSVVEIIYNAGRGSFQLQSPITTAASITASFLTKASNTDTTPGSITQKVLVDGVYLTKTLENAAGNEDIKLAGTGKLLSRVSDTVAGYLFDKAARIGAIAFRVIGAGANEQVQIKIQAAGLQTATFTAAVGSLNQVSSSGAAFGFNLPALGAGDTALQDGDIVDIEDVGGAIETNNITITGNAGNIVFMGQAAAATLLWNGPNYSMLRFKWKTATTQWIGNGYD